MPPSSVRSPVNGRKYDSSYVGIEFIA